MRRSPAPMTRWVSLAFAAYATASVLFALLCFATHHEFLSAISDIRRHRAQLPAAIHATDWRHLFRGAAVSAMFALALTVLFNGVAAFLLLCSSDSLAHPGRRFGRAFVIAAALWTGLHVLNIAAQFHSFTPTMATWAKELHTGFNTVLLAACVGVGYVSGCLYALLGALLMFWKEPAAHDYSGLGEAAHLRANFPAAV